MTEALTELPQAESADPDGVQVALRAAHTLWSNGETAESLRWLKRAAESASDEGADLRSLQLAKAAAELRAKLVRSGKANGAGGAFDTSGAGATLSAAEPPLSDRAVVTATQYPAQRHREAPRPLMGISSATLERVVQRDSVAPGSVPPARAFAEEPKLPPEPPPLPDPFAADAASLEEAWPTPAPRSTEELVSPALSDPRSWSSELPPDTSGRPLSQRPPPMPPPLPETSGITELEPLLYPSYSSGPEDFDWPSAPGEPFTVPANEARPVSEASERAATATAPLTARVHHQAVRVALVPDPRATGQFILRALREREVPQNGERVALLVALEPGTPLV
jgi:hypothetical protein